MKYKNALGSLQAIIITLVIIGFLLGIGFLVLEEFETTLGTTTGTVTNETVSPTDAGIYVAYNHTTADVYCYHSFTPTSVQNGSDVVATGNYSYSAETGRFWNLTSAYVNASTGENSWNVTYTYKYGANSSACEGLFETIEATKEIPVWLTIIVILLIVGILLAIVFRVLPTSGEGSVRGGTGFGGGDSGGVTAEI